MQLPALNLSYTGAMEWLENHSFLVAMYVILSLLNVFFFFFLPLLLENDK